MVRLQDQQDGGRTAVLNTSLPDNPSAPPGRSQHYARAERERRFLLSRFPAGEIIRTARITDRYLPGTRLRLRRSVETTGDIRRTYFKLTQKIAAPDGGPGQLTTLYLNEAEFDQLSGLAGALLHKTRHSIPPFGIDVFDPPLSGLMLAECEFEDESSRNSFAPPPWVLAEVTTDVRFTGGRLATLRSTDLPPLLASFGIVPNAD
jgi:CYTH domain-containing protein